MVRNFEIPSAAVVQVHDSRKLLVCKVVRFFEIPAAHEMVADMGGMVGVKQQEVP